jgi:hypothetical protein
MNCSDFLDSYSDFRDGAITDAGQLRGLREHLVRCLACARYDASVRHGVRALGEIEPSDGFRDRLRARLVATADEPLEPNTAGSASVAAALMLAAAVALVVYEGDRWSQQDPAPVPVALEAARPVRPTSPARPAYPVVVVNPGVPFVSFMDLSVSPFQSAGSVEFHAESETPLGIWANLPR